MERDAFGTGGWLVSSAVNTNIEMEPTQGAGPVEPASPENRRK